MTEVILNKKVSIERCIQHVRTHNAYSTRWTQSNISGSLSRRR